MVDVEGINHNIQFSTTQSNNECIHKINEEPNKGDSSTSKLHITIP